jgi:hypothetical protein
MDENRRQESLAPTSEPMLKLLTCAQGHFWEVEETEANGDSTHEINFLPRQVCPTCGSAAESIPDLNLVPSDTASAAPAPAPPAPPTLPPLRDAAGRPVVAGYEILDDGSRSPRGVLIYKAKQVFINRTVTLKVVFGKEDASQRAWGCLRGEATALGKLSHPNIVQIHEVGERERQLFYNAVEHVDGVTLADKVRDKPLTPRQAAGVIETLARAIHAAHEKGLLHRTLKPASILVAGKADTPIEQCTLKITDFGQGGRPTEGDINDVDLQGTLPHYLSPEQAWGRVKDFGRPTDVWALGAILYELLTGRPPFVADNWSVLIDKIQGKEVPPPLQIQRRLPADLDAICRKCLAKSPRRRYASALALAEDLRRHLDGYPVRARPVSYAERLTKWIKRRPLTAALVLLALMAGVAILTAYLIGRSGKTDQTPYKPRTAINHWETDTRPAQAEQRAQQAEYFRRILLAEKALAAGEQEHAQQLLGDAPGTRHWEWYYLRDGAKFTTWRTPDRKPIRSMATSSDGRYLAVGTDVDAAGEKKSEVRLWDLRIDKAIYQESFDGTVDAVALGGNQVASTLAAAVSKPRESVGSRVVVVPRFVGGGVPPGMRPFTIEVAKELVTDLAFSPDQEDLAVGQSNGKVVLYDATTGVQRLPMPTTVPTNPVGGMNQLRIAFSKDSQRVGLCDQRWSRAWIWHRNTLRADLDLAVTIPGANAMCLAFSSDDRLAVGSEAGNVWFVEPGGRSFEMEGHARGAITAVAFSPDAKRLATAGQDKTVKVCDTDAGMEILTLKDLPAAPVGLAFSADGHRLAVAAGNEVRIYGSGRP